MSIELKAVLNRLEEGKRLTLKFPSPKEMERFRVSLYRVKRELDEIFLVTDDDYECEVLKFDKHEDGTTTIYLIKKSDLPKRGYSFEIVGEENDEQRTISN